MTSRTLYDRDVLEKKVEIESIKKMLAHRSAPNVIYENMNEWTRLRGESIRMLRDSMDLFVSKEEYLRMSDYGITPSQSIEGFGSLLFDAFKHISKGEANYWVYQYADTISHAIIGTVSALVRMDLWRDVYQTGREGVIRFFIHSLLKFFSDCTPEHAVDSIVCVRYFACRNCAAVVHRTDKNGWCSRCRCG